MDGINMVGFIQFNNMMSICSANELQISERLEACSELIDYSKAFELL